MHDTNDVQQVLYEMAIHIFETAADMRNILPPSGYSMSCEQLSIAARLASIKRESAWIIGLLTGEETEQ